MRARRHAAMLRKPPRQPKAPYTPITSHCKKKAAVDCYERPHTAVSAATAQKVSHDQMLWSHRLCSKSMGSARRNPGSSWAVPIGKGLGPRYCASQSLTPIVQPHQGLDQTWDKVLRCIVASPLHNF